MPNDSRREVSDVLAFKPFRRLSERIDSTVSTGGKSIRKGLCNCGSNQQVILEDGSIPEFVDVIIWAGQKSPCSLPLLFFLRGFVNVSIDDMENPWLQQTRLQNLGIQVEW